MNPILIKYTHRLDLDGSLTKEPLSKLISLIYYEIISVMDSYHAKTLEYFKEGTLSMRQLNEALDLQGKTVVHLLNDHIPEGIEFGPTAKVPLKSVRIKPIVIDKSSLNTCKIQLYLTSDWLTLLAILPHGILVASGDQSENIKNSNAFDTYLYPYGNGEITQYKAILFQRT
jgi:hypothetical protein